MLTDRQREIYDYVTRYVDDHGYPPTVREIGEAVGLASPSTVHAHLANLERAGLHPPRPDEATRARADRPRAPTRRARTRGRAAPPSALRRDRRRRPAARRAAGRGVHRRPRAALARRRGGVPAARQGRLDDPGRDPRRRRRGRRAPAGRASNGEIVVALAGDDETADEATVKTLLPRERPHPAPARERRARADLRAARPDPRPGDRGVPLALMEL